MKPFQPKQTVSGFTGWELVMLLITVVVLVLLILPAFSRAKVSRRMRCSSYIKQIGLAHRLFSGDHGERFSMTFSTNDGGSLEFIGRGEVFRHYLAISNELNNPEVLTCSADSSRKPAVAFGSLSDKNVSYFVGLEASELDPQSILSGDRNLTVNGGLVTGLLTLTNGSPVGWSEDIHHGCGNVGLGDGSAQQQVTDLTLQAQIRKINNLPARLEIPR